MEALLSVLTGNIQHSWNVTLTQSDFLAYKSPIVKEMLLWDVWVGGRVFFFFSLFFLVKSPPASTFCKFLWESGGMRRLTLGAWLAPPTRGLRGSQTARGRFRWPGAGGAEHRNGPSEPSIRAACRSDRQKKNPHTEWAQNRTRPLHPLKTQFFHLSTSVNSTLAGSPRTLPSGCL